MINDEENIEISSDFNPNEDFHTNNDKQVTFYHEKPKYKFFSTGKRVPLGTQPI